jgi:hypothetical protein
VAARVAETSETSDFTSIKQRVDNIEAEGKTAQLEAVSGDSVAGSEAAAGLEESLWICPIEDRRGLDSSREGMIEGFSLGSCVKLTEVQPLLPHISTTSARRAVSAYFCSGPP